MPLSTIDALNQRKSIRAFQSDPIPTDTLTRLLESAGRAPSSKNTQPWELHLIQGNALESLRNDYLAAYDAELAPEPDYTYSPNPLPDEMHQRARECGFGLFAHKGIGRKDVEKRIAHGRENYRFFGAPQLLLMTMPKAAFAPGVCMDCGMFYQSVMLALTSEGFGACPMFSAVHYPKILHKHLPECEEQLFLAGLAIGTPSYDAHVNAFTTTRRPIAEWLHTHS